MRHVSGEVFWMYCLVLRIGGFGVRCADEEVSTQLYQRVLSLLVEG